MSKSTTGTMDKVVGGGCRGASACVAALAVLTAAGEARATTTLPVQGAVSKAYANASWATQTSTLGTFGAGVSYNTALGSDVTGQYMSTDNTATVDLELFGQTFSFVGVEGKLSTTTSPATNPEQYIGVTVAGFRTLLSQTVLWNTDTSSASEPP